MACNIINQESYSPIAVQQLKNLIRNSDRQYAVFLDGMTITPKTMDRNHLDDFEQYVNENTKALQIQHYHGKHKTYDKHIFHYKPFEPEATIMKTQGLGEAEIDQKITAAKNEWEAEQIREKLTQKEKDLKEAEEYIELLSEEITKLKQGSKNASLWGELGSTLLTIVKANPQVLSNIPILSGLAGAVAPEPQQEDAQASFSKKSALSEQDEQYLHFLKSLQASFSKEQFTAVIDILQKLSEAPQNISAVSELLN